MLERRRIGHEFASFTSEVEKGRLRFFAKAVGETNPIYNDESAARKAGMADVFAHGMLSMAYLGRMLTNWQPQSRLRKFGNRFAAITHLQDVITCSGRVVELIEDKGETLARCEIQAAKAKRGADPGRRGAYCSLEATLLLASPT